MVAEERIGAIVGQLAAVFLVMGAQRAVTGTLGSVVSNVVTLAANGTAIVLLEWRFAVISLILLPLFIVPAKRVGRRLQDLARQQMDLNASMNTTMTERFNVSGALLVKLFGHLDDETREFSARADGVRAVGVRSAVYGRTFFVALGLVFSAYASEVFLGALRAIGRGQYEAAHALGLRPLPTLRLVILPQLVRLALPGIANLWLVLLKDTSLVSVIALSDLLRETQVAVGATKQPFFFFLVACLVYLGMSIISSFGIIAIERWSERGTRRA